mgnify:CR=1 FL=1
MAGEDLTSSALELPPLVPLSRELLTEDALNEIAQRICARTWRAGLPQWSWGEGVFLLAHTRYNQSANLQIAPEILQWFEKNTRDNFSSGHVNNIAPGAAAARLLAANAMDTSALCEALLAWINDPASSSRSVNGAIEHWPGSIWADTCYMTGTFLTNYGLVKGHSALIEESGRQIIAHAELLQNPQTHLFAHGSHREETIWSYWGRGNAWMALASVEFLEASRKVAVYQKITRKVHEILIGQLKALMPLLPAHGVWDVLVDGQVENRGIIDSSATAGLCAALFRAGVLLPEFKVELHEHAWRALGGALAYVDGAGVLTRTSAGTILQLVPFGYSVIRSDRMQLWGQGLALNAISAALDVMAD